jgi:ABC-2 type transport system ATP-binding protein
VDLAVPRGAVFGFLGPNGSGKTTTIRMLLGLLRASAGEARVLGAPMPRSLDTVLPRVGALVEGPAFSPFLTGEQNLRRFDAADRHSDPRTRDERVARALERVGLTAAARKKAHAYSLGMKQRLGLANALLMPRELLVLDEPTNGLDPQGTREVRALIRSFSADGTTVFVSSHLLAEVEQLCTHVGVMSGGRLVAQGTLEDFRRAGARPTVRVRTPDTASARTVLAALGAAPDAGDAASDVDAVTAVLPDGTAPEAIVEALVAAGVRVRGFEVVGSSLEQRFVELTGEGFDVVS